MALSPAQWMEVTFDLAYLAVIFGLMALMSSGLSRVADPSRLLHRLRDAFLLLAIGDTGHVGFRVVALLHGGDFDTRTEVFGVAVPLVGLGALSTAITVTLVYLLFVEVWRLRFGHPRSALFWSLMAVGVVRLAPFFPEQNEWSSSVPP